MSKIFLYDLKRLQDADLTTMRVFNAYSNNSLNLVSNMQTQHMIRQMIRLCFTEAAGAPL